TLERVIIGCCEVDGGGGGGGDVFGGGVFGGSVVFNGDGVGKGVRVKAPISMMIVRVPEKDKWCGARGKFMRDVIVDRGEGEDIKYGYCKNRKKTVKTGQTRTRERKKNTRARRMLPKSYTSPNAPIGGNPQGECHADARKHTKG
ncbi:hypothetical protein Tco_1297853, partial [Tanacetum coccineum]